MKKTAVVLFNLGGPDSKEAIRPFLLNFFTDANIIRLPYPMRWMIAQLIAWRRSKKEAGTSYGLLGDKSPLLENSQAQADALEAVLNAQGSDGQFKTFVCMRYWHPMANAVSAAVKAWNPDHIVLLPLYPQYSTTTTRSSWQAWQKACRKTGLNKPQNLVCCYPSENGFIKASAALVHETYRKAEIETGMRPRILFSAHGLPEKIIAGGDPYQWQCEKTAESIVTLSGLEDPDWMVCFQSRVGPQKWLKPSTEDAIRRAALDGVPVVILPHAFTQEHVETLVEIEIEYRELADHLGLPGFYRVPTVGVHPEFIQGLADMARTPATETVAPAKGEIFCPAVHKECARRTLSTPCAGKAGCRHAGKEAG